MTGELALRALQLLSEGQRNSGTVAELMVARSFERAITIRDAFEDEGGTIIAWKDQVTGRRWCSLHVGADRIALGSSDQNSADAEASAFQNMINERAGARLGEKQ